MAATQIIEQPTQPDTQYAPDRAKYHARTQSRKQNEALQKSLPAGFPERLESPLVWDGKKVEKQEDWVYQLSNTHLDELDGALKSFKALGKSLGYITQSTFPLPTLHDVLRGLSEVIHHGRGFVVVRGLRVDDYSREDNIIIYTGLSSHIANIRGRQQDSRLQDGTFPVISHIKDISETFGENKIASPSNTADKQVFHTDAGDIISLLCLNTAAEAGESYLSSSWNVYNILAKERPDLIHTLSQDWPVDGFGNPDRPFSLRPLLYHQAATADTPERVLIQYGRRYFTGYLSQKRSTNIPPISEEQAEALDALHFLAEEHRATLGFHKGDIQYVNNLSIFHARNGYRDEPGKERHLIRLWLRDPENAWETPKKLQPRWDGVYKEMSADEQGFPLEPLIRKSLAL